MRINISQLKKSPGSTVHVQLEEQLPALDLAGEVEAFLSPVKVQLSVSNTGDLLLVKGFLEADLELKCSLCLVPFTYLVRTMFEEEFSLVRGVGANSEGEGPHFVGDKDYLDLGEQVSESLLLSMPMKPVCQPECQGLCPHCGRNRNETLCDCRDDATDPRMAVLKRLLDKDSGEGEV